MAQVLVLYHPPKDPAAFDKYYREKHVPIAKRIPKLRDYQISKAPPTVMNGTAVHLVAQLTFDTTADIDAAIASDEGQDTIADLGNFADTVSIYVFDTEKV